MIPVVSFPSGLNTVGVPEVSGSSDVGELETKLRAGANVGEQFLVLQKFSLIDNLIN
jgi:hypothetical protein